MMVANLAEHKRAELVVQAVAAARTVGQDIELRIYSAAHDPAYAAAISALGQELVGSDPVIEGVVGQALADVYRDTDVVVVGGPFESFCLPLVEGMRSGCAVVAPRCPVVEEICGDVALTFTPDDEADLARALAEVRSDFVTRSRAGVQRSEQFQWSEVVRATFEVVSGLDAHAAPGDR